MFTFLAEEMRLVPFHGTSRRPPTMTRLRTGHHHQHHHQLLPHHLKKSGVIWNSGNTNKFDFGFGRVSTDLGV